MSATKQAYAADRPESPAHGAVNGSSRSQDRLESTRAVLTRAATELSQVDATLRGEAVVTPFDTANILEYGDRSSTRGAAGSARPRTDRARLWTREVANLRGRAVKCGLRTGAALNPLAQVTEDALASAESMLQELATEYLECERLRSDVRTETDAWEHLFAAMPLACVVADRNGCILDANHAAGLLLNLGPKRLKGRNLLVFSRDRAAFAALLQQAAEQTGPVTAGLVFRPRERKPLAVTILVVPPVADTFAPSLWFLTASSTTSPGLAIDGVEADGGAGDSDGKTHTRCVRCGDDAPNAEHRSEADCVAALERRIRGLRGRVAEVQDRCALLSAHRFSEDGVERSR